MPAFPFDLPGPRFLAFFLLLSVVCIGAAVLLRRVLESGDAPRIDLSDPYLLACLRAGKVEALRVAVLSLLDRGFLEYRAGSFHVKAGADPGLLRRPLERSILASVGKSDRAGRFFERDTVLLREAGSMEEALAKRGLLPDAGARNLRWMIAGAGLLLLGGVGIAKIAVGLSRDRPVGFLVLLTLAFSVLLVFLVRRPLRTARGDAVLRDAQTLYARLRARASSLVHGGGTADAALLAGAYGAGALVGSEWRGSLAAVTPPKPVASGSSCGSSFSSCGSSCGGGCGGGCGGCGG